MERLINIFQIIEGQDILAYLEQQDISSELNDVYWTLYFSTGYVKYLDKPLEIATRYYNEMANANYYMAARSAIWSISSNIRTFPSVSEYIQRNTLLGNDIKEYIVNTDPDRIQMDTIEFINQQRQKGIW
jgi:hypothetical protein